jgi:hypothetical protein
MWKTAERVVSEVLEANSPLVGAGAMVAPEGFNLSRFAVAQLITEAMETTISAPEDGCTIRGHDASED